MFSDDQIELAEQLGVDVSELDSVLGALSAQDEMENSADSAFGDFLSENDLIGLDLDTGEFF